MDKDVGSQGETRIGLGWLSILAPLGLGFVLSLVLAYQAFDAGRRHRETARASAREQAQFAAYLLSTSVDRRMREALLYGFYPVDLALGRPGGDPPPAAALRVEPEIDRCEPELSGSERWFFRYSPGTGDVDVDGSGGPVVEAWVRAVFGDGNGGDFGHLVADLDGDPTLVAFRRWSEAEDVVYGFRSCWRTREGSVFARAVATTQAFSPSLVGSTPNDSLFTLTAHGPGGDLVYGEPVPRQRYAYGGDTLYGSVLMEPQDVYAGLRLRVTLLPDVVERLVEGGLPPSRLPLAFGLIALNGLLMWVAVRQLRRGHELVTLRARFVRNVSHELRTPLQQILLFTDLLRSGRLRDPAEGEQALDIMHAETRRLIELVRNVLRFSGSEHDVLRLVDLDLADVVRDSIEAFRPLAVGASAELDLVEEGRPVVRADEDAVKRILVNLLDNAVKYGPQGQRIRVCVRTEGKWGVVSVLDEGPGVPSEERGRIWEAFRRLDREEEGATAGSGIGLSIVRRLAEGMEGRATVENGPQSGASFVVRLPLSGEAP